MNEWTNLGAASDCTWDSFRLSLATNWTAPLNSKWTEKENISIIP